MQLMLPNIAGMERRIWASACIVAHQGEVSPDYVLSKDPFIGLLRMSDECECLRFSRVMQIHAILHDAYGKLWSEYGISSGYFYAIPFFS